jgi:threonine-phosphate decarboxylase
MTVHGGDVWQVGEQLGIEASELLDFSANINPRGLPLQARERLARDASDARLLSFYPDPSALRLRKALSEHLGVAPGAIVVGPGAEALLAPILQCLQPEQVLVPVPAFSEYRRVCEQLQIQFAPFALQRAEFFRTPVECLRERIGSESPGVALLNNPHNPSGSLLDRSEVQSVVEAASSCGTKVILDEAFIDYVPRASLVGEAASRSGLIVLRSLTKFYGCPALRVGYAVAHPDTISAMRSLLPTWPVTQLAMDALAEAVGDREYAESSRKENATARQRLTDSLSELDLIVFPSAANYLLLELNADMRAAADLRSRLIANHRILIRDCDSYEGLAPGRYVRVAVRAHDENRRLIQAFAQELRLP